MYTWGLLPHHQVERAVKLFCWRQCYCNARRSRQLLAQLDSAAAVLCVPRQPASRPGAAAFRSEPGPCCLSGAVVMSQCCKEILTKPVLLGGVVVTLPADVSQETGRQQGRGRGSRLQGLFSRLRRRGHTRPQSGRTSSSDPWNDTGHRPRA